MKAHLNTMIPISQLEEHPDNPRKSLGDLTELADSIRKNGIMQNLTVVPVNDDMNRFRVIIGHRRMAAAKKAGFKEVPCNVIMEMDEKEQLATMLAENMQRVDLTVYEQVKGIQMMMDLGESVESVSDRTGLSKTTIQRRKKLADLDEGAFHFAEVRGATLMDLEKIAKIDDPEKRKKIMMEAGTRNFQYEITRALEKQKEDKKMAEVLEVLKDCREIQEEEYSKDYVFITALNLSSKEDPLKIIDEHRDAIVAYRKIGSGCVSVYRQRTEEEKKKVVEEKEKERTRDEARKRRIEALNSAWEAGLKTRENYIQALTEKQAEKHFAFLVAEWMNYFGNGRIQGNYIDCRIFNSKQIAEDIAGVPVPDEEKMSVLLENPARAMIDVLWNAIELNGFNRGPRKCYNWDGRFTTSQDFKEHIEYLKALMHELGYVFSEEEESLMDGTNKLYLK